MDLNFNLHEKQLAILRSDARFKVCAAGRRGGKSWLAAVVLLLEGLKDYNKDGVPLKNKDVYYIAPTFNQAKKIMFGMLKDLGKDVIVSALENTASLKLINGRVIELKGSDRPDTLRGVGVSYVVLDEFADMRPETWETIIRPTLADVEGGALFIGTPKGRNHFYDLWLSAEKLDGWEAFQFNSTDNPTIKESEVAAAREIMTTEAFRQEFEASFEAAGGGAFKESEVKYVEEMPSDCTVYMAVDPAGYGTGDGMVKSKLKRLDEFAISVVGVNPDGWYIQDVISGRWGIREASLQVIRAASKYKPVIVGIEGGALKNAIDPYLQDQMKRLGVYPVIEPVSHGGQRKEERILWALQGRFQNGRIHLVKGEWNKKFVEQLLDFPNPLAHDDLIDSTAYIDKIANTVYNYDIIDDDEDYDPDPISGY